MVLWWCAHRVFFSSATMCSAIQHRIAFGIHEQIWCMLYACTHTKSYQWIFMIPRDIQTREVDGMKIVHEHANTQIPKSVLCHFKWCCYAHSRFFAFLFLKNSAKELRCLPSGLWDHLPGQCLPNGGNPELWRTWKQHPTLEGHGSWNESAGARVKTRRWRHFNSNSGTYSSCTFLPLSPYLIRIDNIQIPYLII